MSEPTALAPSKSVSVTINNQDLIAYQVALAEKAIKDRIENLKNQQNNLNEDSKKLGKKFNKACNKIANDKYQAKLDTANEILEELLGMRLKLVVDTGVTKHGMTHDSWPQKDTNIYVRAQPEHTGGENVENWPPMPFGMQDVRFWNVQAMPFHQGSRTSIELPSDLIKQLEEIRQVRKQHHALGREINELKSQLCRVPEMERAAKATLVESTLNETEEGRQLLKSIKEMSNQIFSLTPNKMLENQAGE